MSENPRIDEELNTARRAKMLKLDYVDTSQDVRKPLYPNLMSIEDLYRLRIVPIHFDSHNIMFGITNNTSQQTLDNLKKQFLDQNVSFVLISDTGYRDYMKLYDPPKEVVYHDIQIGQTQSNEGVHSVSLTLEQVKADDMLAYLVVQAHKLDSSDIHIETQTDGVRIRLRIDGVLHTVAMINLDKYRSLIGAIASAGNISTTSNEAQQGHIYQKVEMANNQSVDVNVRLETTPTINGMDVVMRLFNMDQSMFTLEKLGLSAKERAVVDSIIKKPSGLVLVVGPTGSGKTTTLYSILNSLNTDERKIITIEDPVEYQFKGITQIPVAIDEKNDTMADKLRAVLRLDPDVIMVGEIRDLDTARTALQASLTGHLVLATFHASSAAAAITRLIDVIDQNPLFISSIRLVMAQRLVRRLDDSLKRSYRPEGKDMEIINQVVSTLPSGIPRPDMANLQLYKPGSSPQNPFGYSGQIAIREQFMMTGEILKLMSSKNVTSTDEIEKAATNSGMTTMLQDGILKVIAGKTAITEIYRELG